MAEVHGMELPAIGLGTGPLRGDGAVAMMVEALRIGYRLLDTSAHYGNEREVGQAVRASGVPRDEIIVMTKIWPNNISGHDLPGHAEQALARLGLDRIDLLLPHWPNPDIPMAETIGGLNELRRRGITREIGLSNFPTAMMEEAQGLSEAPLIVNQVEFHPYLSQDAVRGACAAAGMAMIAHCPLGRAGALFGEPARRSGWARARRRWCCAGRCSRARCRSRRATARAVCGKTSRCSTSSSARPR